MNWTFNIGHLLTILVAAGSGAMVMTKLSYTSGRDNQRMEQFERELISVHAILSAHETKISAHDALANAFNYDLKYIKDSVNDIRTEQKEVRADLKLSSKKLDEAINAAASHHQP